MHAARPLPLLAALPLLAGCAAPPLSTHYDVHVRTTWQDPTPVFAALDRWHEATGVAFDVSVSDDVIVGRPGFRVGPYPLAEVRARCGAMYSAQTCAPAGGYTDAPAGLGYTSDVMIGPVFVDHTLMHELGHALGLVHVHDPSAIMYPDEGNDSTALAPIDVAQYDALRALAATGGS